jgi:hypothetical protein
LACQNVECNSTWGAESGTPRDLESGVRDHLVRMTDEIEEVAQEHKDLERFGSSECNTLQPLLLYCCCV